ncbi:MAG: class A beta-lactamase-related serine hydrolase, partial [Anaerolinea sp.]|nr:class A beta-lactamase-related serine hydrolase [Anaerolinea sp.]
IAGWRVGLMIGIGLMLIAAGPRVTSGQEATPAPDPLALLWEQIAARPVDFAIGCMPLNNEAAAVLYQPDARFPLASVSKLLIFMEYARQLESGAIPFDEMVAISALERYHLPGTDLGAHEAFMARFPDGMEALRLRDVAVGVIQYSSNAASDYLLDRLAPADWDGLFAQLQLTATDPPHAFTLIPLLMNNHETGRARLVDVPALSLAQGRAYLERYLTDDIWRAEELTYRARRYSDFPGWRTQAAILQQHTATGTVRDFLRVLRAIYGPDSPLSLTVRTLTRAALRWSDNDYINARYSEYGSKLGFYSGGVLTLVAYGQPIGGFPVISAIFLRNLPRPAYRELLERDAIGELAHWLNATRCIDLPARLPVLPLAG